MDIRIGRAVPVAALLLLAAAACTDPTVAPKSTVTGANIWADPTAYESFIAKLYGGLILTSQAGPNENCDKCGDIKGIDEGFSEYLRLYWYLEEVPTDEAVIGWGDAGLPELNRHTWDATDQMVNAMYYRIFFQVALANEFLRQTTLSVLDSRGVTTTLKAQIQHYRAEARFLRALAYAHGVDLFGSIPLITENDPVGGAPPQQATRTELYDYVVSELTSLRDSLPAPGATSYGRATPAAADMLLAEMYLNAEVYTGTPHYDLAVTAAASAIAASGASLNPVFRNNFTADNNLSPELIFVAAQDGNRTQTWGGMTFLVHAGCGGSMSASWFGMDYCWGGYRLKQQVYRLFDTANDSRAAFFYVGGTTGQTDSVIDIGSFNSGTAAPKFTNMKSDGVTHGSQVGMIDTDFPIFRLAEAYLIYAEANIRGGGGNAGTALGYLNALRERAFGDATHDFAALPVVDTILAERARELMFEGKRRTDLIRFGVFTGGTYLWAWKNNTPGGAAISPNLALYPIPANELAANPNLTQNPGY
jgi:hypothetical protein